MKLLLVTAEYPPQPGGVGAYTFELAKALAALGCEVSVLTGANTAKAAATGTIPVFRTVSNWGWQCVEQIAGCAQALAADWVHVQYQTGAFAMHPAINFAPWWWQLRRPRSRQQCAFHSAWTYHDLLVPYLFPKAGDRLRNWVTRWPAVHVDLSIVTNEEDRLALVGQVQNLAKIPIGSNIVGRQLSAAEKRQQRSLRGYHGDDLVIGYFGFLNPSKGGQMLIRALDRLVQAGKQAQLLMIGERVGVSDPTNFAYLQTVEALIAEKGLASRVQWTGQQADAQVSADLNICDVLLMPYTDGASLRRGTLMAGLAHGCAIVTTTPRNPLPELVAEHDLVYVPRGDDEAAANAVLRIVENPALATTLRQHALISSQQFRWEQIAADHLHWYAAASATCAK